MSTVYYILLIALLYPVSFFAHNSDYFRFSALFPGIVFGIAGTAIVYGIVRLLARSDTRALVVTLLLSLLFWGFSPLAAIMTEWGEGTYTIALLYLMMILTLILLAYGARRFLGSASCRSALRIFIHVSLLLPLLEIGYAQAQVWFLTPRTGVTVTLEEAAYKPDIYYIILDAYGRDDILSDIYHFNNGPFLDFLREKGFYTARDSRSNYAQTPLSLASSLNMDYLPTLLNVKAVEEKNRLPLAERIRHSAIRQILATQGYRFVNVDSGFQLTTIDDADTILRSGAKSTDTGHTEFAYALLHDSPLPVLWSAFAPRISGNVPDNLGEALQHRFEPEMTAMDNYAARMVARFHMLNKAPRLSGPKFVFAHITSPHPPFVFKPDDSLDSYTPRHAPDFFSMNDGSDYTLFQRLKIAEYIIGYREQLTYINRQMMRFVSDVLANHPDSIIIIQGDHGPGSHLNWAFFDQSDMQERFSILNSYYFPDHDYRLLTPSMTPVNSFRVVLNKYFGTQYPMLAPQAMYSSIFTPYQFIDVSKKLTPRPAPSSARATGDIASSPDRRQSQ